MDRISQVIDRIYAAALDASVWPEVTESLRSSYDCRAVGLYAADMSSGRVSILGMRGIDPGEIRSYVDHHLLDNPWTAVPALQRAGVIRTDRTLDEHYGQPGYYRATPLFNEWMKPQDFIYTLGTNLCAEGDALIKFFMYRPERAGTFSGSDIAEFSRLSGHLSRSLAVARRLDLKDIQLEGAMHLVDGLRLGVIFLDGRGRISHANRYARRLLEEGTGLTTRDGIVCAARAADTRRLAGILATALEVYHGTATDVPGMIDVARPEGRRPLRVIAVPLPRRSEGPWFTCRLAVALIVSDPEAEPAIPCEWLRQRYGLTAREAQLAQSLGQGATLREAAERNGVTYETARWHLKNIFQKTGTVRQSELVRLLLSEQALVGGDGHGLIPHLIVS